MNTKTIVICLIICAAFGGSISRAGTCPPPPSSVAPTLKVSVKYDGKTKLYTYYYSIENGRNAQIPIDGFGLLLDQTPISSTAANHWLGQSTHLGFAPGEFVWDTAEVAGPLGKKITGDATLVEPTYVVKPGASLSGFSITSAQPPGVVQFFAEGFTQPPTSSPTAKDDEATPDCPGWDLKNPQLQTQVTGMTTGPSDPGIVSVSVRARDESGEKPCKPIQPKNPEGKLSVLVLSSSTFNASTIDISTVVFGPAFTSPLSSRTIPAVFAGKLGFDEKAGWEKALEDAPPKLSVRQAPYPKDLLLVFDIPSLDVQCNLDQALFLRGKTTSGQQFVGAVSANLVGCGEKDVGKHKHHPFPYRWWNNAKPTSN